ncbi:MAG TPA: LamG-like jellyroll fold domain-containing protein [Myxococcota bacterium]|nr:LamG-like jellyroll fold domain-containing protein [Myxococcota bacterium]
MTTRNVLVLSVLVLALAAAGCGGGGGSGDGRDAGAIASNPATNNTSSGGISTGVGVPGGGGAAGEAAFEQGVYKLTRQYCINCHAGSGPGFPAIADPDPQTAFRAVVDNQKVSLTDPNASRLVHRLADDKHFCWTTCPADAATMQAAIQMWADAVVTTAPVDPNSIAAPTGVITSEGRGFINAQRADSGRFETGVIAKWKFDEGAGTLAQDSSSVGPTMNMTLSGTYSWMSGGGVDFEGGMGKADPNDSVKLYNELASGSGSNQYSVEAWIIPSNITQGTADNPARIVTYGNGPDKHNFMIGQAMYDYVVRNRANSMKLDGNGEPALKTDDGAQRLQANLQHAVITYDQTHGRQIYVNGVYTTDKDPVAPALLLNWDPTFTFAVGKETTNNRTWKGVVKMLTIFRQALTPAQIMQNYLAGSNQLYTLRFGLDSALGNGAWIQFTVSEYDAYSYLFCAPLLDTNGRTGFSVQTLRIAVNGTAPVASQAFRTLNTTITQSQTQLSQQCQIVPKDLGAAQDMFYIFFDTLGTQSMPIADLGPNPPPQPPPAPAVPFPGIGVRDFAEINNTMSKVTGVATSNTTVSGTYSDVIQQLPTNNDPYSFVSAQQVGIARLSLDYCDQMVENTALRNAFFGAGSFDFTATGDVAFNTQAKRDAIINPLVDNIVGKTLADQPDQTDIRPVLNTLFDQLTNGCTAATCTSTFTKNAVKGVCSAVLSSAAAQIQ